MSLIMTAGPAAEPVSVAEAKAHLRVDTDDEDELIAGLITAARIHIETRLGRILVEQAFELWLDRARLAPVLSLPLAPVRTVASVTALDEAGEATELDLDDYALDLVSNPARLFFSRGVPEVRRHNGLRIAFTAGYGPSSADVPQPLRHAVLLLVAHWYEEREPAPASQAAELPHMVSALLAPYRRVGL